jgi:hypothetical protein
MMNTDIQSPRISSLSWGQIEIEGLGVFKDAKLFPGGGRAWDWAETGTSHSPGIQPADVEELLAHGAEEIVLSRGIYGRLQVKSETLQILKERGIRVHVSKTREAVRLFNQLRESRAVGGLFHTTC